MSKRFFAVIAAGLFALPACSSLSDDDQAGGNVLRNLALYGGTTVPPAAPVIEDEVACPQVDIVEGGAALRAYTGGRVGESAALRSQIAIGQLARECRLRPDGRVEIKIGVEARALIGPAGGPGRFDVPLRFVVRGASEVYDDRSRRATVTIPAGQTQASITIVEEGLTVPASVGDNYIIEVGLGAAPARSGRRG